MRRVVPFCLLAGLTAASMLALNPTSASAFDGCSDYSTQRAAIAPRARVYGYTALRRPYYRSRAYRARYIRPGVRRRW
jgi:hypothetical protein